MVNAARSLPPDFVLEPVDSAPRRRLLAAVALHVDSVLTAAELANNAAVAFAEVNAEAVERARLAASERELYDVASRLIHKRVQHFGLEVADVRALGLAMVRAWRGE